MRTAPIYRASDYPGFSKRLCIDLIDIAAILAFGFVSAVAIGALTDDPAAGQRLYRLNFLAAFVYLGPLKSTRIPTLGYLLFRVKLIDIEGGRPTFWQASGRALMLFIGPVNFLLDLFWLYSSSPRQALRDTLSGTFLIRNDADG